MFVFKTDLSNAILSGYSSGWLSPFVTCLVTQQAWCCQTNLVTITMDICIIAPEACLYQTLILSLCRRLRASLDIALVFANEWLHKDISLPLEEETYHGLNTGQSKQRSTRTGVSKLFQEGAGPLRALVCWPPHKAEIQRRPTICSGPRKSGKQLES